MKHVSIVVVIKYNHGALIDRTGENIYGTFGDLRKLDEQTDPEKMLLEINKRVKQLTRSLEIHPGTIISVSHSIFMM